MPIIAIDRWVLSTTRGNRYANKYIVKSIFDFLNSNGPSESDSRPSEVVSCRVASRECRSLNDTY